ncbi:MAG: hypothetical protein ACRER4_01615 [Steroidobacteraceae bacterium]
MARYLKPPALAAGAILILVLAVAVIWMAWRWNIALDRMEMMMQQAAVGFLQPPSSTRIVRIDARDSRLVDIDAAGFPQRIDLQITATTDRYDRFRVSILRDDGTLVLHADRMVRDSNSDLRLSFNTSLLPNGRYRIPIEGYTRSGELQKYAEAKMQVAGR